jgi:hypothetical protein
MTGEQTKQKGVCATTRVDATAALAQKRGGRVLDAAIGRATREAQGAVFALNQAPKT